MLDGVHIREQLIYDGVLHARGDGHRVSQLADSADLIKDDDVRAGRIASILLRLREDLSHIRFRLGDILVEALRDVDDLRFACVICPALR